MPTALLDDADDLRDGFRGFGKLAADGFRSASALAGEPVSFLRICAHGVGSLIIRWRSPVRTRLSRALRSTTCVRCVGIAVRLGSAVCPQSVFVCLESPNRGGIKPSRPKPRSGGATASACTAWGRSGSPPSAAKGHLAGQSVRRLATTDLTGPDQTRVSDAIRQDLQSSG
jgi:hypothetical protein